MALVEVLVDNYSLPNGGLYNAGDVVELTTSQHSAIPNVDFGAKVQDTIDVSSSDTCIINVNQNLYKLANGGTYNNGDTVALRGKEYYSVPAGDRTSIVTLRSKAPALTYDVTINTGTTVRSIPRGFLGVSMEVWDVLRWTGKQFAYNALAALNVDGNNVPPLRLGGGSADGAWWNPTGLPHPANITYDYNASYVASVSQFLNDTAMKATLCLNMGTGNTQHAVDWAVAAQANLPAGSIRSFQIGNEPDNYPGGLRSASYALTDYLAEIPSFISAVVPHIGSLPLTLPSFASFKWYDPTKFDAMNTAGGASFLYWDQHRYPLIATSNPTIPDLFDESKRSYMNGNFSSIVTYADAHGKKVTASELNTVGLGGTPGVSNSQAGALWLLRAMLDLAQMGVSAVNVYGLHDHSYTPINVDSAGAWSIQSPYYAMRMFALATQHDSSFVSLTSSGLPTTLSLYALRGSDNYYRVVAVNIDDSTDQSAAFALPTSKIGSVSLLTASSLAATNGLTLAGQTYDGSSDGNPKNPVVKSTATSQAGKYRITVPAHSAVLVEVPV